MTRTATIPVTVAKEHLISLGERMYVDSVELLRELVANAYDADATEARITITSHAVTVEDNGSGMSGRGLAQYFEVGSSEKRTASLSPVFGRKRIGQFGIGKFAALAAADRFTVESMHRGVRRIVTFDKRAWREGSGWELPVQSESAPDVPTGTIVRLEGLHRQFSASLVERFLRESVPIHAKKFAVVVNGKRLSVRAIPGRVIPYRQPTLQGMIEGEFLIAANPRDVDVPGIECRVRGVLIRRESFGLDSAYPSLWRRVTGSIEAEFLPIIAARTDFVRDRPEFLLFAKVLRAALERILQGIAIERDKREEEKLRGELRDAIELLRRALKSHPELVPSGRTVARPSAGRDAMVMADTVPEDRQMSTVTLPDGVTPSEAMPHAIAPTLGSTATPTETSAPLTPAKRQTSVTRQLRIAKLGVTVAFTHLGEDGPEAMTEGNLVYLNEDHPLYQRLRHRRDLVHLHLMRLLTQEVAQLKFPKSEVRDAFTAQSVLLRDAMADRHVSTKKSPRVVSG